MLLRLILLFTLVPLVELALLMWISRFTTIPGTIALVLATGLAGAALARHQGWQTWLRLREELRRGEPPADALLDGAMILVAGALMITPGILTDVAGFALLIPRVRRMIKTRLRQRLMSQMAVQLRSFHARQDDAAVAGAEETIIDAEFTRKDEQTERGHLDE